MKEQSTNDFVLAVLEELVANGKISSVSLYAWFVSEQLVIQDAMARLKYESENEKAEE